MIYYVVDAFADHVFEGNPAGVCILEEWLPIELMEKIAIENNLSETAFAVKEGHRYGLRWFTPGGEIDLCGHATMATAYIIFEFIDKNLDDIVFYTKKAGHQLTVSKTADLLVLDFPVIIPIEYETKSYMIEALGAIPRKTYRTEQYLIFEFDTEEKVRQLTPDFKLLKEFPIGLSVFITARSNDDDYDFVARAFWPKMSIDEDPVTGAMYCCLVPYWKERFRKDQMIARQVSKRGGTVYCECCGDRVKIGGKSVLYLKGNIYPNIEGVQV